MTTIWIVIALAAGFFVGWLLGARSHEDRAPEVLRNLAASLDAGHRPTPGPDAPGELAAVRDALERRWAPRNEERERALREALGRIAAFLRQGVRDPLARASGQNRPTLEEGVRTALGAIQDLEFFLREPLTPDETHNLVPVVQQVTREFTTDWEVAVRLQASERPVRAHIHRDSFMDAVYLLLHNAGQFGGGKTVDVSVTEEDDHAAVTIRDHGPGFTAEALEKANDLFYSTTEAGLGLGIPFARKIVESLGGSIRLRNADAGGAEVTLSLPLA